MDWTHADPIADLYNAHPSPRPRALPSHTRGTLAATALMAALCWAVLLLAAIGLFCLVTGRFI